MVIFDKPLAEIHPYEHNPRMNDQAVDAVARSIAAFGFKVPIIVDRSGVIVAGHTRLKAAEQLGLETVPCIVADDLSEEQVKAFRLADNKVAELAEWDLEALEQELSGILEIDMEDFGFDLPAADEAEVVEDEPPEPPEVPISRDGDVWQLGNHRLICGDSTDPNVIKKVTGGEMIDCVITDPPYNVNYEGKAGKIQNDNMDDAAFREFLKKAFKAADAVMKPGAVFYIWHADSEGYNFRGACRDVGWQVRQCLIWNKDRFVLGRQDYHWKHEPCLYGWKDGAGHYFVDDRTQATVLEDVKPDFKKMKKDELRALLEEIYSDRMSTTVIDEARPMADDLHPTMKPLKFLARLVKNSTRKDEAVLDPFGGSGSTLITCEQLDRACFTCELDPHYCDVIIERWETFTGNKAVKLSD